MLPRHKNFGVTCGKKQVLCQHKYINIIFVNYIIVLLFLHLLYYRSETGLDYVAHS